MQTIIIKMIPSSHLLWLSTVAVGVLSPYFDSQDPSSISHEEQRREFLEAVFISDTSLFSVWQFVNSSSGLVALWIHSSVVFIKMTKKLSVQHPTANLPHSSECSHDLLALRHTEAHTNPSGSYVILQCRSEVWKRTLSYLLCRETVNSLSCLQKKRCPFYFRKMFFAHRQLLHFSFISVWRQQKPSSNFFGQLWTVVTGVSWEQQPPSRISFLLPENMTVSCWMDSLWAAFLVQIMRLNSSLLHFPQSQNQIHCC